MSEWIVYSKDGLTERCRLKKLEYAGSYMNERTVTATFEYHSEVAFEVFDYIVYRGERFELEAIPSVKKTSKFGYTYELRFVSLKYELERCEMRDIVPNDNGVTYPSPLSFSFTGSVRYLAERIQANLDSLYGKGVWTISVASEVSNEEKNITISQQNCWNALSLANTSYGLDFSIKGRNVTIGKKQPVVSHVFQYGKGNGLYEIERIADTNTGIVTKLRAYGSTRNLDYSYPKKPEWADSVLPVSFILSPLRLMLPSFKLDGKTDYIMANDSVVKEYGIRESSMIYEDIYPTITDVVNSNGDSIDEIMAVEEVDDSSPTFVIYLYDLGFDLESNLTTEDAQISMKSGAMQGYTFNISKIEKQEDNTYKVTLGRITTDSSNTGNYDIPNSKWGMSAGDKFVLLNILMPQEYIRAAEQRLLVRAQEYLAEYGKTNFSYNIGLNDKFLKEHENIYDELIEGSKLSVYDEELGIREEVTIQSITIDDYMEDNILPQVKVTLNNKPSASTLERIQGKINELSDSASNSFSTQTELLQQYRKKLDKPFFDRLFAAVDKDGKEIPSTDLSTPISYIKARFSLASLGGLTMYLDDKSFNLPTIYDGLPIDSKTIYWEDIKDDNGVVVGKILKAKIGEEEGGGGSADFSNVLSSGSGNAYTSFILSEDKKTLTFIKGEKFALSSELDKKWTADEEKITQWNKAFGWGNHAEAGYAAKSYVDSTFVTIAGNENVTGVHDFVNGLKINGNPITYNKDTGCWKLEGNLIVTGGVTMYGDSANYDISSIYDALPIDGQTIYWEAIRDDNGVVIGKVLKAQGGGGPGGGVADSVAWSNVYGKPTWLLDDKINYSEIEGTPNLSVYQLKITSDNKLDYSLIGNTPDLSLYQSKITSSNKLAYTLISGTPNLSKYQTKITSTNKLAYSLISGTPDLSVYALNKDIPSLNGYATEQWVKDRGYATTDDLDSMINSLVDGAPAAYDTLKKIADVLSGNVNSIGDIVTTLRTKWTQDNTKISNWDSAYGWGNHANAGYAKKSDFEGKYVTISGNEDVTGLHDFINGLKIGGIKIHESKDGVIYIEGNLAVKGGVTMYSDDTINIPSFIKSLPTAGYNKAQARGLIAFNSEHFVINNGVVSAIQSGGGLDVDGLKSYLTQNGYATQDWVTSQNYLPTSSYTASDVLTKLKTVDGTGSGLDADMLDGKDSMDFFRILGTNNNLDSFGDDSKLNGVVYINRTMSGTSNAPFDYGTVLAINSYAGSWMLGSSSDNKLMYRNRWWSYNGYGWSSWRTIAFTDSNITGNAATATKAYQDGNGDNIVNTYLAKSSYTASDVLSKLKTVDGTNSGIDADLLDGQHGSYYASAASLSNYFPITGGRINGSVRINGSAEVSGGYLMWRRTTGANSGYFDNNLFCAHKDYTWTATIFEWDSSGNLDIKHNLKATNGVVIGTTDDIGWFNSSGRVACGANIARGCNVGSILISNVWADYTKVPANGIYCKGNALIGGAVTFYSQRSLKNVVDERGLSLDELSTIKPTRYTWKDNRDSNIHFGGIADDIQQVLPEVVYNTKEGILTMDYGNAGFAIAASLIKPVIEHEQRIKALEKENELLKQELNRLRA